MILGQLLKRISRPHIVSTSLFECLAAEMVYAAKNTNWVRVVWSGSKDTLKDYCLAEGLEINKVDNLVGANADSVYDISWPVSHVRD